MFVLAVDLDQCEDVEELPSYWP